MSKSLGGTSTFYAEQIAHKFFPAWGDHHVYVEREVTLSPDLSEIESHRFRYVRFYVRDTEVRLHREAATWLRDALTESLRRVEGVEDA